MQHKLRVRGEMQNAPYRGSGAQPLARRQRTRMRNMQQATMHMHNESGTRWVDPR